MIQFSEFTQELSDLVTVWEPWKLFMSQALQLPRKDLIIFPRRPLGNGKTLMSILGFCLDVADLMRDPDPHVTHRLIWGHNIHVMVSGGDHEDRVVLKSILRRLCPDRTGPGCLHRFPHGDLVLSRISRVEHTVGTDAYSALFFGDPADDEIVSALSNRIKSRFDDLSGRIWLSGCSRRVLKLGNFTDRSVILAPPIWTVRPDLCGPDRFMVEYRDKQYEVPVEFRSAFDYNPSAFVYDFLGLDIDPAKPLPRVVTN